HVTAANVFRLAAVLAAGAALPYGMKRLLPLLSRRARAALVMVALVCLLLGPVAAARLPTLGLARNALAGLLPSALPRVPAPARALPLRALHVPGHGRGHPHPRLRHAGGRGRDRRRA